MTEHLHTLSVEFPAYRVQLRELKAADPHAARLMEEYEAINEQVQRAMEGVQPIEALAEVDLRKKRAMLKDQIARALAQEVTAA
ncbi:DUF465 domain-containing protein [Thioclava sp. GXIMD2076]|uniref:DUF465 domain-containing protein n=1 Tax=Thioclava kandeliae TaxID=3070818 RepID=A0ABV1SHR7_9RHOB